MKMKTSFFYCEWDIVNAWFKHIFKYFVLKSNIFILHIITIAYFK